MKRLIISLTCPSIITCVSKLNSPSYTSHLRSGVNFINPTNRIIIHCSLVSLIAIPWLDLRLVLLPSYYLIRPLCAAF